MKEQASCAFAGDSAIQLPTCSEYEGNARSQKRTNDVQWGSGRHEATDDLSGVAALNINGLYFLDSCNRLFVTPNVDRSSGWT
jgi:hypothetical protein